MVPRINIHMDLNSGYPEFIKKERRQNPSMPEWEIRDRWLDHNYNQDEEQLTTYDQTTHPLVSLKSYREDEETADTSELNKHIQALAQNPKVATLGLKLDSVGKKGPDNKDSRVWYLFSKQTENTPTGPQAKKWGGYTTQELKQMSAELQTIGDKGIESHFNS